MTAYGNVKELPVGLRFGGDKRCIRVRVSISIGAGKVLWLGACSACAAAQIMKAPSEHAAACAAMPVWMYG